MKKRPLVLVFLGLIVMISLLDYYGVTFGIPPDIPKAAEEIRFYDGSCLITGVISARNKTEKGYSYVLKNSVLKRFRKSYSIGRVRINSTAEKIRIGTRVKVYGKLSFYESASNPGGFDARRYYLGDRIYSSVNLRSYTVLEEPGGFLPAEKLAVLRERASDKYIREMGEEAGSIMTAMVTGDRSAIDEETRINYTVSGLSHLLAISGLHVGIIGAALLSFLLLLRIPRPAAAVLSTGFLLFYCYFTGGSESTVRAFVMFAAAAAALMMRKSYDTLSALSLAGIILIFINPYRIFRVGFMLSFGAVAGLAVIYPILRKMRIIKEKRKVDEEDRAIFTGVFRASKKKGNEDKKTLRSSHRNSAGSMSKVQKFIGEGFFVWLSVNAATVPVVLWNYAEIPVYQAAANILLVPMTEMILLFGIAGLAVSAVLPAAGQYVLLLPSYLIRLQEGTGSLLRKVPGAVWITGQPGALKTVMYYAGLFILLLVVKSILRERKAQEELNNGQKEEYSSERNNSGKNAQQYEETGEESDGRSAAAKGTKNKIPENIRLAAAGGAKNEIPKNVKPGTAKGLKNEITRPGKTGMAKDAQNGKPKTCSDVEANVQVRKYIIYIVSAFILMAVIFVRIPNSFAAASLDVGQGDSMVLTSDNGLAFMIDGGSSSVQNVGSNVILPYLKAKGIAGLEGVFLTHNDADHVNGISALLSMYSEKLTAVRIKRVFLPFWMLEDPSCEELTETAQKAGAEVIGLKAGDRIRSGGIEMEVLSPGYDSGFTGNDGSLVLGIKYRTFSGLYTGDLGGEAEELLTASVGHYSILKAGHHGSAGSTSAEFLDAVDPDFCIISAPRISSYGHPAPEMIERLSDAGVPWLQTGLCGTITVKLKKGGLIVEPYRNN